MMCGARVGMYIVQIWIGMRNVTEIFNIYLYSFFPAELLSRKQMCLNWTLNTRRRLYTIAETAVPHVFLTNIHANAKLTTPLLRLRIFIYQ